MTKVFCDITKKQIPNPRKDVNFVVLKGKTLSLEALGKLEDTVSSIMSKKPNFNFQEHQLVYKTVLEKLCK